MDSGTIRESGRERVTERMNYMPGEKGLWDAMTHRIQRISFRCLAQRIKLQSVLTACNLTVVGGSRSTLSPTLFSGINEYYDKPKC